MVDHAPAPAPPVTVPTTAVPTTLGTDLGAGPDLVAEFDALVAGRRVTPVFQPIVDLATGEAVAFEALARGPVDSPLRTPDALFGTARSTGRLLELDRLCRMRALEGAFESGLTGPLALFLNIEPGAIAADARPTEQLLALRARGVPVVVELTERALTDDPARLIAFADRVRALGLAIALDDVGADPASLALMPFLCPDVVKLDLALVQRRPDEAVAEIMTAVTAYAERNGALLLAEGIETAEHERVARSFGATLGQGWHFGRPGPLETVPAIPRRPLATTLRTRGPVTPDPGPDAAPLASPFDAAAAGRTVQQGAKRLLVEVSKLIERQALALGGPAVVLSAFERAMHFTPDTARRYTALAEATTLVVAVGEDLPTEPVPGVRGGDLTPDDPLLYEWDVVVIGPHFAVALVARDLRQKVDDPDRVFDYVLTYDREVVLATARCLMSRVVPAGAAAADGQVVPAGPDGPIVTAGPEAPDGSDVPAGPDGPVVPVPDGTDPAGGSRGDDAAGAPDREPRALRRTRAAAARASAGAWSPVRLRRRTALHRAAGASGQD